jgi:uncharacterized protein
MVQSLRREEGMAQGALRWRRALVTGASSGIGEAFARRLASDGCDVVAVARRGDRLEALAKSLAERHAVEVEALVADLTRPEDLARVERLARERELDLLVNDAGVGSEGAFDTSDIDAQTAMLRLNAEAVLRLTHAALAGMVARRRGAVVNVSSGLAFLPAPFYATYGATKAFVNHFTEAVAEELRDSGVHLQALCPGLTRTEFQERAGMDASRFPAFAWMEPDAVVAESLAALEGGGAVCVPGLGNRIAMAAAGLVPRGLASRLAARVARSGRH